MFQVKETIMLTMALGRNFKLAAIVAFGLALGACAQNPTTQAGAGGAGS